MAQETGTPVFKAPYRAFESHEFGASFSDYEAVSGALEGFYTLRQWQERLRGPRRHRRPVGRRGYQAPAGWLVPDPGRRVLRVVPARRLAHPRAGRQSSASGDDVFLVPIGITLGRKFDLEGSNTSFIPYVHPVLVPVFGSGDSDVEFALGLGVDIRFSERWAVRASGGIGDIEGVGISLAYIR